jgi:AMP deaminase
MRINLLICCGFQVPYEDLEQAARLLVQALHVRERYMAISHQTFPSITSRFLRSVDSGCPHLLEDIQHEDRKTIEGKLQKLDQYSVQ